MDSPHPDVPPRTMVEDAAALHEIYVSLHEAGFTEPQALTLVGHVMVGGREALLWVQRLLDS